MTGNRTLVGLALAAAVAVAAALAAYGSGPEVGGGTAEGPLLPALAERVGATPADPAAGLERIAVGPAIVVRDDAGAWRVPALAGYPADPAVVDRVVANLAGLSLAEPLTRRPDRFPLLGLAAPPATAAGAAATRATLRRGDGAIVADLWVGDARPGGVGRLPGHYVRRAAGAGADDAAEDAAPGAAEDAGATDGATGDGAPGGAAAGPGAVQPVAPAARAWLVAGPLDLPRRAVDWIDPTVVDLAPDRITRLTIETAGAAPVVVVPAEGAAAQRARDAGHAVGAFVLADPTAPALDGRVVARAFRIDNLVGTLDDLDLIDVRPVDGIADRPVAATATAETNDGLTVRIETRRDADGTPWLTVAARADAAAPPDVAAEAAAVAARTGGWAYRVPAPDAARLAATADDLAEPR